MKRRKIDWIATVAYVLLFLVMASPAISGLILSDIGADDILAKYFNASTAPDLSLRLYCTSTSTTSDTLTYSNFTECAGGGYSQMTLTHGNWTITTGNDPSDAVYTAKTFTFTGALTTNGSIYGYYVTSGATGTLIWHEGFVSTFTPTNNGDSVTITPKFQLSKGTPN